MKTNYSKEQLVDAVIFLMQLYEIKCEELKNAYVNDDYKYAEALKELMVSNMFLGTKGYLEHAMSFIENTLKEFKNV